MALICLFLLVVVPTASAQFFNPTVSVQLEHPPGLGLKIDRIAFGPNTGRCSGEIVDALIADFVSNNVEVIDRQHLNSILDEHDLSLSGYVDQASAATIGKILGPSALLFVNVQRCTTEQKKLYKDEKFYSEERGNYVVRKYIARTRAFLSLSVRTVDLTTGRIFAASTFEQSPEQSNESYEGHPEFPSEYDLKGLAIRIAVAKVHRLFLPWSEQRSLVYFNNKACGLKQAYLLLKGGDTEGSLQASEENLKACLANKKSKPKIISHAYYNVGMGYMIRGDEDSAIENFREASRIKASSAISKAMADCQKSKTLKAAMLAIDERASIETESKLAQEAEKREIAAAKTVTVADVISMIESKLPDVIIIAKIKSSKVDFDMSMEQLTLLNDIGASVEIITTMIEISAE